MSFVTLAALAVALFVGAPVAAHLLRRQRTEERLFPAARLVPATPPLARKRSRLEDRSLFGIRALAVLALALLGATPLFSCERLAVVRKGGASVALALVVDDSMSMRAPLDGGQARKGGVTRFDRAREAAEELVAGAEQGDAIAVVLAGAPPRVALAATTNLDAVRTAVAALRVSDRATDLDGAVQIARELLDGLAQPDKRVVLLSDLADGAPDRALDAEGAIPLWAPLSELLASGADCGIVRADRAGDRVHVRVVCTEGPAAVAGDAGEADDAGKAEAPSRAASVLLGDKIVGRATIRGEGGAEDILIEVPHDAPDALTARLDGVDAIAEDDVAPVIALGGSMRVAVIADASTSRVETGGPPPIEQAFAALGLDAEVRPLPSVPEHPDELDAFAALFIDDAPGLTPEVRRSLAAWVSRGGIAFITLGPRAASAPLGAGFDPLIPGVIRWGESPSKGVDEASAATFGASTAGLFDLAPRGRTSLDPSAVEGASVLARWSDGAPFLVQQSRGRGAVMALTLPLSTEESDLALRPAFLVLLERVVATARARGGARRILVGEGWTFDGFSNVRVQRLATESGGPPTPIEVTSVDGHPRAVPDLAGRYELDLDGQLATRVAAVPEREIDLRPRRALDAVKHEELGGMATSIDASPQVALLLLGLLFLELLLRAAGQRKEPSRAAYRPEPG